jgi:hypothetical protein
MAGASFQGTLFPNTPKAADRPVIQRRLPLQSLGTVAKSQIEKSNST